MTHETAGDPVSGLKWTHRTTAKLAHELRGLGIHVCPQTVARLLKAMGYSLRVNHKKLAGASHPNRDQPPCRVGAWSGSQGPGCSSRPSSSPPPRSHDMTKDTWAIIGTVLVIGAIIAALKGITIYQNSQLNTQLNDLIAEMETRFTDLDGSRER